MPDDILTVDSALSLMNSAPATPGVADWTPDEKAPPAALPQEKPAAQEPAADPVETKQDTPASDTPPADKDTPAGEPGDAKDDKAEPGSTLPPIEPPTSWKTEEKEVFKSLPRAAQEAIARREQDRTTELRNLQNTTAEQRKQVDGELARLKGLADQIEAVAQERIADLAREFPELKTAADVEALAARDPTRYGIFQARLMRLQSAQTARQQAQAELSQRQQAVQQEQLTKARDALLDAFPAWKDPSVGRKEMTELQDYAISLGVPEPAARTAIDPFVYKLAQKAMAFDRAQKQMAQAIVRDPPKVIAPGAPQTKQEQTAGKRDAQMRRLEKSGDIDDAIGLLRM